MPGGRPTKYKPDYPEKLIEHMKQGFPYETFAGLILVSREVLYDWEKKHPEFLHAKKVAREAQYLSMFKIGQAGLLGQIKNVVSKKTVTTKGDDGKDIVTVSETYGPPSYNATTWIFMMKNCFGWKDNVQFSEDDTVEDMDFEG